MKNRASEEGLKCPKTKLNNARLFNDTEEGGP
jgi:hypothetical protein